MEVEQMSQISIIGDEGKPVLYASLTLEGKLFFEFEYYGRNENEGDYEFTQLKIRRTYKSQYFIFIC